MSDDRAIRNASPTDATGVPLTEDALRAVGGSRARLDAAYRTRAWTIAMLVSCICCHPNEEYNTATGHHPHCPSHLMIERRNQLRAGSSSPDEGG